MVARRNRQPRARETIPLAASIPPVLAGLNLRQSLFLAAALLDSPTSAAYRYARQKSRLGPHWRFGAQMLTELADAGLIVMRGNDSLRIWGVPQAVPQEPEWSLSETLNLLPNLQTCVMSQALTTSGAPGAGDELFTLWRELAIAEVVDYLATELAEHRFDEAWALAAVPALERGLRRLSINQMFYFCWLAVRETASRYLRFPNSISSLSEGLVSYIDQRIDRTFAERWAIRDWGDNKRTASAIALVFAEKVTGIGSDYLGTVPSRDRLGDRLFGEAPVSPFGPDWPGAESFKMGSAL